jgi:hypothetical protein
VTGVPSLALTTFMDTDAACALNVAVINSDIPIAASPSLPACSSKSKELGFFLFIIELLLDYEKMETETPKGAVAPVFPWVAGYPPTIKVSKLREPSLESLPGSNPDAGGLHGLNVPGPVVVKVVMFMV